MSASTVISAAAANEFTCGFDCGDDTQYWVDVLASALSGLAILPLALLIVWACHRLKLDRWLIVTAAIATLIAIFVSAFVHELVYPIFLFFEKGLEAIGINRFMHVLFPSVIVCFLGAFYLAWWFKRSSRHYRD